MPQGNNTFSTPQRKGGLVYIPIELSTPPKRVNQGLPNFSNLEMPEVTPRLTPPSPLAIPSMTRHSSHKRFSVLADAHPELGLGGPKLPLPLPVRNQNTTRVTAQSKKSRRYMLEDPFGRPHVKLRRSEGLLNLEEHSKGTSLKRPLPLDTRAQPATNFLARCAVSPSGTSPAAITSQAKRLHLPEVSSRTENAMITPDNSFRTAKPLQTAFVGSGLVSKRHRPVNQGVEPPETPCKRPLSTPMAAPPRLPSVLAPHTSNTSGSDRVPPAWPGSLQNSMERFSLNQKILPESPSPGTPTRQEPFQTSTPFHFANGAGRQISNASTVTPGTVRHRPALFVSGLDPLDSDDHDDELGSPRTPDASRLHVAGTSDVHLIGSSSMDSAASVSPRASPQSHGLRRGGPISERSANIAAKRKLAVLESPRYDNGTNDTPKTPGHCRSAPELDLSLAQKFDSAQELGKGEFSAVFVVKSGKQRFAVKRLRQMGSVTRRRFQEEVSILRELTTSPLWQTDEGSEYVLNLAEAWSDPATGTGYIMTDFCENGDLDRFLAECGSVSRLEEWRVWKIMVEIALGLRYIHALNILHLDLKPANVLITFEGQLKIGDFGMATRWPVSTDIEREGDREYIAPEILSSGDYGKPADMFSLGIMMVEIAANIVPPDNGVYWQKLRSGDLSDAGQLSSGDLAADNRSKPEGHSGPPKWAPFFMTNDSQTLDRVVEQLLNPTPSHRPTAGELLAMPEAELVNNRRQAGAIVYEGAWGPEPVMLEDPEMQTWRR